MLRAEWEAVGKALPRTSDPDHVTDWFDKDWDWPCNIWPPPDALGYPCGWYSRPVAEADRAEQLAALEKAAEVSLKAPGAAMRAVELAEHYDRRVQRFVATWYKPSRALEEKRFKKLPKVALKLFPRVPVDRAAMRAEWELKVSDYLFDGFKIEQCPPETTTAMLNKRKVGRPRIHASNAEKQKRWRDKQQRLCLITASPPRAGGEQEHGHDIGTKHSRNPRGLDSESSSHAKPETAG